MKQAKCFLISETIGTSCSHEITVEISELLMEIFSREGTGSQTILTSLIH